MKKSDYIEKISKASNRYGDKLIELMDKYNRINLCEVTIEERKSFTNQKLQKISKKIRNFRHDREILNMSYGEFVDFL